MRARYFLCPHCIAQQLKFCENIYLPSVADTKTAPFCFKESKCCSIQLRQLIQILWGFVSALTRLCIVLQHPLSIFLLFSDFSVWVGPLVEAVPFSVTLPKIWPLLLCCTFTPNYNQKYLWNSIIFSYSY